MKVFLMVHEYEEHDISPQVEAFSSEDAAYRFAVEIIKECMEDNRFLSDDMRSVVATGDSKAIVIAFNQADDSFLHIEEREVND